jgi:hypothetical protein
MADQTMPDPHAVAQSAVAAQSAEEQLVVDPYQHSATECESLDGSHIVGEELEADV